MKAIEIDIKITIPVEIVERENLKLEDAYSELIEPLRNRLDTEGVLFEGEAHEI